MGGGLQNDPEESFGTCGPAGLGFYSLLFLIERGGGWLAGWLAGGRLVVNLSTLNSFVMVMKFQMETIVSVLGSIRKGTIVLN